MWTELWMSPYIGFFRTDYLWEMYRFTGFKMR